MYNYGLSVGFFFISPSLKNILAWCGHTVRLPWPMKASLPLSSLCHIPRPWARDLGSIFHLSCSFPVSQSQDLGFTFAKYFWNCCFLSTISTLAYLLLSAPHSANAGVLSAPTASVHGAPSAQIPLPSHLHCLLSRPILVPFHRCFP